MSCGSLSQHETVMSRILFLKFFNSTQSLINVIFGSFRLNLKGIPKNESTYNYIELCCVADNIVKGQSRLMSKVQVIM